MAQDQENSNWCNRLIKCWWLWGSFLVVCALVICLLLFPGTVFLAERWSAAIAVIDDLFVRVVGIIILMVGTIGLIRHLMSMCTVSGSKKPSRTTEVTTTHQGKGITRSVKKVFADGGTSGSDKKFKLDDIQAIIKYSSALVLGGAAFAASYPLDALDSAAEKLLSAPPASASVVLAKWVQVVSTEDCRVEPGASIEESYNSCPPVFQVRAVVRAPRGENRSACPRFDLLYRDGSVEAARKMSQRKPTSSAAEQAFEGIQVCTANIDQPRRVAALGFDIAGDISLPENWSKDHPPERIAMLGDTGCRKNDEQVCDDKEWPFRALARQVEKSNPDLIIHLGDYMYAKGVDDWAGWKYHFFGPAQRLLQNAPWVMVRGNHETCGVKKEGALGFHLFFGVGNDGDCGKNTEDGTYSNPTALAATYAVDISPKHRLIVADSTLAYLPDGKEECSINDDKACEYTKKALAPVGPMSKGKTTWLVTHVPPFALEWLEQKYTTSEHDGQYSRNTHGRCIQGFVSTTKCQEGDTLWRANGQDKLAGTERFPESTAMMRAVLRQQVEDSIDLSNTAMILAADRHQLQVVEANDTRPLAVVMGTSGVNLDSATGGEGIEQRCQENAHGCTFSTDPPPKKGWLRDDDTTKICTTVAFGHLDARYQKNGYALAFITHKAGPNDEGAQETDIPCSIPFVKDNKTEN